MTAVSSPARPSWVPDDLYPFEDRWADIGGSLVHYVDEGEGQPILLLNGNPSWSFGWRDVIRRLRASFRCIAPDYPGFGLSRAASEQDLAPPAQSRTVERLVDHLGLRDVIVFGYAWGGPIGLAVAARRPELVRGLVIGNSWAWPVDRLPVRLFSALLGGPLGWLLVERLDVMQRLYLPLNLKRARLTARERRAYQGPFAGRRSVMRVFPRAIVSERPWLAELETRLGALADRPVLLVWADSDRALGTAELSRWQSIFPRAETVSLERTGEFIDEDAPDDVADAVERWWRSRGGQPVAGAS